MATTLSQILKNVLKAEGESLDTARKDLKTMRRNKAGIKCSRKLIAGELRSLKAKRLEADRNGGGAPSAALSAEINFLRQVLNELSAEAEMGKLHVKQCGLYVKQQHEYVVDIDREYEAAKAAEPVVEEAADATTEQA